MKALRFSQAYPSQSILLFNGFNRALAERATKIMEARLAL